MQIREGFVANSSSMMFILDLREEETQKIVNKLAWLDAPVGLGRASALAVGQTAVDYGHTLRDDKWVREVGEWILEWVDKLGEDNIVMVRASDEGMGGYVNAPVYEHALDTRTYH